MRPSRALHQTRAILLAALCCYAATARGGDADSAVSMFSFSGFGTVGAVHSSESRADFTNSIFEPSGAGFSHAWSTDVDSRIAAQVIGHLTSQLSATVQVISEQRYDNTYQPHVEWANLKYQPMPDLSVRVGRTVLSSFMFSDTRKLGYANPWVRPPIEVYGLVPVTNSDGVDASYKVDIGRLIQTLTASYGRTDQGLPPSRGGGQAHSRQLWLISDTLEYGAVTGHITYQEDHLTVPGLNGLFDALRNFGTQGTALADKYDLQNKLVSFIGLGAMYDPRKWFVMGEWGRSHFHSVLGESTAWYASGGYRWSQFTPYVTYSEIQANSNTTDPGLTLSALPSALVEPAMGLNAGLNAILGSIAVQKTYSVGTRWDFMRNVALKLQYDHSRLGAGSPGTLTNVQPDFRPGGTVNLLSITVDFVL